MLFKLDVVIIFWGVVEVNIFIELVIIDEFLYWVVWDGVFGFLYWVVGEVVLVIGLLFEIIDEFLCWVFWVLVFGIVLLCVIVLKVLVLLYIGV